MEVTEVWPRTRIATARATNTMHEDVLRMRMRLIRSMRELCSTNALLRSRGETLEYNAEEVGWELRNLGFYRHKTGDG